MSQDTPLKTLFRMRPELERDVLRFATGQDVPYATALGWVLEAAEIAHAALEVDQVRRERARAVDEQLGVALEDVAGLKLELDIATRALVSKTAALELALRERDAARGKLVMIVPTVTTHPIAPSEVLP